MTGTTRLVPWLFCLATAVWFGWLARSNGRNWVLWALGGGLFGLAITTIVLGLGHAVFVPISHEAYVRFAVGIVATAAVVVLLLGWVFTANLHGHHRSIWARIRALLKK
jgi:hypothetical protein